MAIRLEFKSDSKQAQKDLISLNKSVENVDRNTQALNRSMQGVAKAAKVAAQVFAAGFAVKGLTSLLDKFTNIENRIALVTGRNKELAKAFKDLQVISIRARGGLEGVADLYNRLGRSTKDLGTSQKDLLKATEAVQKAITISGGTQESANAAIFQLGQGLAAGALRGQELNSVLEQTPRVAQAIADSLGVGVGGLRDLAQEGKLTSEVVLKAFLGQAATINKEYTSLNATFAQGFSLTAENFSFMINEFVQGLGIVQNITASLVNLAASFQEMSPFARKAGEDLNSFFQKGAILGGAFLNVFRAIGAQLGANLPRVFGPAFSLFRQFNVLIVGTTAWLQELSIFGFFKVNLAIKSFVNSLTGGFFRLGEFQKAVFKLSRPESFDDFIAGLNLLAAALDPERFTSANLARNLVRGFDTLKARFKILAVLVGLVDGFFFQLRQFTIVPFVIELLNLFGVLRTAIYLTFSQLSIWINQLAGTLNVLFSKSAIKGFTASLKDLGKAFSLLLVTPFAGGIFTLAGVPRDLIFEFKKFFAVLAAGNFNVNIFSESVVSGIRAIIDVLYILVGTFTDFDKQFDRTSKAFQDGFNSIFVRLAKSGRDGGLGGFFSEIFNITVESIVDTLDIISTFATNVINFFKEIYDKVIGNSYWVDTIQGVIGYAQKLGSRALAPIRNFERIIVGAFSNILLWSKELANNVKLTIGLDSIIAAVLDFGRATKLGISVIGVWLSVLDEVIIKLILWPGLVKAAGQAFSGSWEGLTDGAATFADTISLTWKALKLWASTLKFVVVDMLFFGVIATRLKQVMQVLKDNLTQLYSTFTSSNLFSSFSDEFSIISSHLSDATSVIGDFAKSTIAYFAEIYDKIIGNSYWVDTVEGVISWSKMLVKDAGKLITFFVTNTIKTFSRLPSQIDKLRNTISDKLDFVASKGLKIAWTLTQVVDAIAMKEAVVLAFLGGAFVVVNQFKDEFPEVFAVVAGIFVQAVMKEFGVSASVRRFVVLGHILSSNIDLRPAFHAALTFVSLFAEAFGKAVGQVLYNSPKIAGALIAAVVTAAEHFGRAMLDQLGFIGDFLRVVTLGTGNVALGIVGLFLFGRIGLPLLTNPVKLFKGWHKEFGKLSKAQTKAAAASAALAAKRGTIDRFVTRGKWGLIGEAILGFSPAALFTNMRLMGRHLRGLVVQLFTFKPALLAITFLVRGLSTAIFAVGAAIYAVTTAAITFIASLGIWGKVLVGIALVSAYFLASTKAEAKELQKVLPTVAHGAIKLSRELNSTLNDPVKTGNKLVDQFNRIREILDTPLDASFVNSISSGFDQTNSDLTELYNTATDVSFFDKLYAGWDNFWDRLDYKLRSAEDRFAQFNKKTIEFFGGTVNPYIPPELVTYEPTGGIFPAFKPVPAPGSLGATALERKIAEDRLGSTLVARLGIQAADISIPEELENFIPKERLDILQSMIDTFNRDLELRDEKTSPLSLEREQIDNALTGMFYYIREFQNEMERLARSGKKLADSRIEFGAVKQIIESSGGGLLERAIGDSFKTLSEVDWAYEVTDQQRKQLTKLVTNAEAEISNLLLDGLTEEAVRVADKLIPDISSIIDKINDEKALKNIEVETKAQLPEFEKPTPITVEDILPGLDIVSRNALKAVQYSLEAPFKGSVDEEIAANAARGVPSLAEPMTSVYDEIYAFGENLAEIRRNWTAAIDAGDMAQASIDWLEAEEQYNRQRAQSFLSLRGEFPTNLPDLPAASWQDVFSGFDSKQQAKLSEAERDAIYVLEDSLAQLRDTLDNGNEYGEKALRGSEEERKLLEKINTKELAIEKRKEAARRRVDPENRLPIFDGLNALKIPDKLLQYADDAIIKSLSSAAADVSVIESAFQQTRAAGYEVPIASERLLAGMRKKSSEDIEAYNEKLERTFGKGGRLFSYLDELTNSAKVKAPEGVLRQVASMKRGIEVFRTELDKLGAAAPIEAQRSLAIAEEQLIIVTEELNQQLEDTKDIFLEISNSFAEIFTSAVFNGSFSEFSDNFVDLLLGNVQESLTKKLASFTKAFLDVLLGPDGIIGGLLGLGPAQKKGEEAAANLGATLGEAVAELFGITPSSSNVAGVPGHLRSNPLYVTLVGAPIALPQATSASAGVLGTLTDIWEGIKNAAGYATGGRVSGPGTGISDSIPAMLSHGEYVVNAKATARNAGLLSAINSGMIPKFADGGFVGYGDPVWQHHFANLLSGKFTTNPDGSISTVRTAITGTPGDASDPLRLIPTIWDGKELSVQDALQRALATGIKWPTANSIGELDAYDQMLHTRMTPVLPGFADGGFAELAEGAKKSGQPWWWRPFYDAAGPIYDHSLTKSEKLPSPGLGWDPKWGEKPLEWDKAPRWWQGLFKNGTNSGLFLDAINPANYFQASALADPDLHKYFNSKFGDTFRSKSVVSEAISTNDLAVLKTKVIDKVKSFAGASKDLITDFRNPLSLGTGVLTDFATRDLIEPYLGSEEIGKQIVRLKQQDGSWPAWMQGGAIAAGQLTDLIAKEGVSLLTGSGIEWLTRANPVLGAAAGAAFTSRLISEYLERVSPGTLRSYLTDPYSPYNEGFATGGMVGGGTLGLNKAKIDANNKVNELLAAYETITGVPLAARFVAQPSRMDVAGFHFTPGHLNRWIASIDDGFSPEALLPDFNAATDMETFSERLSIVYHELNHAIESAGTLVNFNGGQPPTLGQDISEFKKIFPGENRGRTEHRANVFAANSMPAGIDSAAYGKGIMSSTASYLNNELMQGVYSKPTQFDTVAKLKKSIEGAMGPEVWDLLDDGFLNGTRNNDLHLDAFIAITELAKQRVASGDTEDTAGLFFKMQNSDTFAGNSLSKQMAEGMEGLGLPMGARDSLTTWLKETYNTLKYGLQIGGYATGGKISGPGTGTSDSIMARLSHGEFVVNAKSASKHSSLLHAINSGMSLPGFANGGSVGGGTEPDWIQKIIDGLSNNIGNVANVAGQAVGALGGGTPLSGLISQIAGPIGSLAQMSGLFGSGGDPSKTPQGGRDGQTPRGAFFVQLVSAGQVAADQADFMAKEAMAATATDTLPPLNSPFYNNVDPGIPAAMSDLGVPGMPPIDLSTPMGPPLGPITGDAPLTSIFDTFVNDFGGILDGGVEGFGGVFSSILSGIGGSGAGGAGGYLGLAASAISLFAAGGGKIVGPGSGTADRIPAMLSNGEFVVNARATKKFGPIIAAMNAGADIKAFAAGGYASDMSGVATVQKAAEVSQKEKKAATGSNNNVTFALEGDFDSRTERAIRKFINTGSLQSGLNQSNIENGGSPVFKGR